MHNIQEDDTMKDMGRIMSKIYTAMEKKQTKF